MSNRLLLNGRVPTLLVFVISVILPFLSFAQAFTFLYPGPTQVAVGADCMAIPANHIGTPLVTALTPMAQLTRSEFDPIASGFSLNTPVSPSATALAFVWVVEDDMGNSSQFTFNVTFSDLTPPVFDLSGFMDTLYFESIVQVPAAPTLVCTDNCTANVDITKNFVESTRPDTCVAGSFIRTWTATDATGNSTSVQQVVQIAADDTPPVFTVPPVAGSGPCQTSAADFQQWLTLNLSQTVLTDASGPVTLRHNAPPTYDSICPRNVVVRFTAQDQCGYENIWDVAYFSEDTNPPVVLAAPRDTIVNCDNQGDYVQALATWISQRAHAAADDACSPQDSLVWTMEINGAVVDSAAIQQHFQNEITLLGCGTRMIGGQLVTKVRAIAPVNFFATDPCGNVQFVGTGIFAAIDTMPPAMPAPSSPQVAQCGDGDPSAHLQNWIQSHGNINAQDPCSSVEWVDFSWLDKNGASGNGDFTNGPYPSAPSNDCTWWIDLTFRAEDICANAGESVVRFSLVDTVAPVFGAIAPIDTVYCPDALPSNLPTTVTDGCDLAPVVSNSVMVLGGNCNSSAGILRVTWTATDKCGNSASTVQIIHFLDTIPPSIGVFPADITLNCANFTLPDPAVLGQDIQGNDLCGTIDTVLTAVQNNQNPDPNVCAHYTYTVVRTFTVVDACGNTNTAQQTIFVEDTTGPEFLGVMDTTVLCQQADSIVGPIAMDACGGTATQPVLSGSVVTAGVCADTYTLTRTWESTDICGNVGVFIQTIEVADTIAPVLQGIPADAAVDCTEIPMPPTIGTDLLATDNCDETVTIVLNETETRNPDNQNCAHYNYELHRTWIALDNCGNSSQATQILSVSDTKSPELVCPENLNQPTSLGQCGANLSLPQPLSLYDACTATATAVVLKDTAAIQNTSGLPSNTTPVDTIRLNFSCPNFSPNQPAIGSGILRLRLHNADAERDLERFAILSENGQLIGLSAYTNAQCGDSETAFSFGQNTLNQWMRDGSVQFTLIPTGTGTGAINAVCPGGGMASVELEYQYAAPVLSPSLQFSINNGTQQSYPPNGTLNFAAGTSSVTYTATDCSGNSATCSFSIAVRDEDPPSLGSIPNLATFADKNGCTDTITLPYPSGLEDNCGFGGQYVQVSAEQPVKFFEDPNASFIPAEQSFTFGSAIPNASGNGFLTIRHLGDNNSNGEFFEIFQENGNKIGTGTTLSSTACSAFHETKIALTASQINTWAADGNISFRLVANNDAGVFSDFISPCGPLQADSTDGVSKIQVSLTYPYADIQYVVKNTNLSPVLSGQLLGTQTQIVLPIGAYTLEYSTFDAAGNGVGVSSALSVADTVAPVALCKPIAVFLSASGTETFALNPAELNAGSYDVCSPVSFSASKTNFTCDYADSSMVKVILTVKDSSGNTAACESMVRVQTRPLNPSFSTGLCQFDTLQLMAHPADSIAGFVNFAWNGPRNFGANTPNPIIPSADTSYMGAYTVVATGLTGCTATGQVNVQITSLPNTPILSAAKPQLCDGDDLILRTQAFFGSNVRYHWYAGTTAQPTFLGETINPEFLISNPPIGNFTYYSVVSANGCMSLPSDLLQVSVSSRPAASVNEPMIELCEGQSFSLGTAVQGVDITYAWDGPNGFQSTNQFPPIVTNTNLGASGNYRLIVYKNGCPSAPVFTQVNVLPRPSQPSLAVPPPVCAGSPLTLLAAGLSADRFEWVSPNLDTLTTTTAQLTIPNSLVSNSGNWQVIGYIQGCASLASASKTVDVVPVPVANALSNSPVCAGLPINFSGNADQSNVNYQWIGPNFISFNQNPSHNGAAGSYLFVVTNFAGCADSTEVTVERVANPSIAAVTNDAPTCADGTTNASLTAVIIPISGTYSYQWTNSSGTFTSVEPNPTLPNVTEAINDTYTLTVRDQNGCISPTQSTTISVQNTPVTPLIGVPGALCEGQNAVITVQNANQYAGQQVQYTWQLPVLGTQTTSIPSLSINNLTMLNSGHYQVLVTLGQCSSQPSGSQQLMVNSTPPTPVIQAPTSVCAGQTLELSTPTVAGAVWNWSGPCGFSASVNNPTVQQADTCFTGNYYLTYSVNGCMSALSAPQFVEILPKPMTPIALNGGAICSDDPSAALTLIVSPNSTTPGAQYSWYSLPAITQVGLSGSNPISQFTGFQGFSEGQYEFAVTAQSNGCMSNLSTPTVVTFNTIPNLQANAGMDRNSCDQQPIILNAVSPSVGSGMWRALNPTTTLLDPAATNTQATGGIANTSYPFVWSISNGACRDYSKDTVHIRVVDFEQAEAIDMIDTCFAEMVFLEATQGSMGGGVWSQLANQALLGVIIENPNDPNTAIEGMQPGNTYFFYWTLPDMGCGASVDTTLVRSVGSDAFAGTDQNLCTNDGCTVINAAPLSNFELGTWSSSNPKVTFTSSTNAMTTVCGLEPGTNTLVWTTNNGRCGDRSVDFLLINYELTPTAIMDTVLVPFGTKAEFNVVFNDILPIQYSVEVVTTPQQGTLSQIKDGQFSYQPGQTYTGSDVMTYRVCNRNCPDACATGVVVFSVQEPGSCTPYNVMTPNGDNYNDLFFVPCLGSDAFPDNAVSIFNEYGDEVFHASPYDNSWGGTYNGQPLPAGTYFYVIKFNKNQGNTSGFLTIHR